MTDLSPVTRRTLLPGTGTVAALTLAACGGGSGSGASDAGGGGGDEEIIIGSTNEPTGLQRNVGGSSGISETMRSEERRVGKECRARWSTDPERKRNEQRVDD